jgi:hypothetical protein
MRTRNKPHTLDSLKDLTTITPDGCWIWQGTTRSNGYGVTVYKGKQTTTHRVAYEIANNTTLPKDMEVDHICNERGCINPAHLEAVSHEENMRRGAERRTVCRNGHEWNKANTYTTQVKRKQGGLRMQRYCRLCRAKHQADLRARRASNG